MPTPDYQDVKTLDVAVHITIRRYGSDAEGWRYDWITSSGQDSESLFDTLEDAEQDAHDAVGS